ncbi:hypothetical protein DY000_02037420 [Brassica cretica]|uniref:Uncharacterized protein n=1 Tax=Brassica cretica TaxID=69181 RepID=A0ABQ7BQT3_BRACR|nr:hypothetical protein DY000_02037420 [Brassica cretica]
MAGSVTGTVTKAVGTAGSYWETVKDGYGLIRNCPRAVTDGFGVQKQLWDGYGQLRPRSNRPNSLLMKNTAEQKRGSRFYTGLDRKHRERERKREKCREGEIRSEPEERWPEIKTYRRLIGGYYCMGSRRSERQRQAVDELIGGLVRLWVVLNAHWSATKCVLKGQVDGGNSIWRLPRALSSGTTKAVKEQLELLGVTGETVKDGYRLIRNCPRAVIDGFGAQKQLWDGLTGRQAVEELNGGLGASVGGSERTLERGCVLDALAYAIAHGNTSMCLDVMVMLSDRAVNGSKERCTDVHGSRERVTGTRWFEGRMAVRCTDGIEGCRAEYVLTGQGVIVLSELNHSKVGLIRQTCWTCHLDSTGQEAKQTDGNCYLTVTGFVNCRAVIRQLQRQLLSSSGTVARAVSKAVWNGSWVGYRNSYGTVEKLMRNY